MSTTLSGVDVIDVRKDILIEVRIVRHRHLHRHVITHGVNVYNITDERLLIGIQISDKVHQTMSGVERLAPRISVLVSISVIGQLDLQPTIEECKLPHALLQNRELILGRGKNSVIGEE